MFERVRHRINQKGAPLPQPCLGSEYGSSASPISGLPSANQFSPAPNGPRGGMSQAYQRPSLPPPSSQGEGFPPQRLAFRQSPFYHIQEALTPIQELAGTSTGVEDPSKADADEEMPHNRHSVTCPVMLSETVAQRLRDKPDLRVMIYCTASTLMSYEHCDILFPPQVDVRINEEEVRHNYKGLKNKPGTTKPVDLTPYLRKIARYQNIIQINYALTPKKYSWVVNLVRKSSAEELTEKVRKGRIISKEQVLRESKWLLRCCRCCRKHKVLTIFQ